MRDLNATVAQLLANTLYQCGNEGASLNVNFDSPTEGYMVSVIDGPQFPNLSSVNPLDVAAFIRKHLDRTSHGQYFGVWTDDRTGIVYFDASECLFSINTAIKFAKDNKQIAIWDVTNAKEIRV